MLLASYSYVFRKEEKNTYPESVQSINTSIILQSSPDVKEKLLLSSDAFILTDEFMKFLTVCIFFIR